MERKTWRRHHKWLGLGLCLVMLLFCASGVLLNHRAPIADINIGREWLPSRYEYTNWNGGLLRGTLPMEDRVLIYGTGGMYIANTAGSAVEDFNKGLPAGADYRQIRNVAATQSGELFAVSPFGLYSYAYHGTWFNVRVPIGEGEKLTDVTTHGDTLVVLSRSYAYVSLPPYNDFRRIGIKAPDGYDGNVTAFRAMWLLHSGELFGSAGKLVVDAIAVVLALLCATGFLFWLLPKVRKGSKATKWTYLIHDRAGRYTIALTMLLCLTGWSLRPPVMVALMKSDIPVIPGTKFSGDNAWDDKLRMVRYDNVCNDWLISTSNGFFALKELTGVPVKVDDAPPVSVMGLNVWRRGEAGEWLCGSFSGMCVWRRSPDSSASLDYATGQPTELPTGMPFGKQAVSGFSPDFACGPFVVEYYEGTEAIGQPESLSLLPMSLWNVALEVHSGRIFIGPMATVLYVFVAGALCVWCLWSGWKVRQRRSLRK